eukprot:gene59022-78752_t
MTLDILLPALYRGGNLSWNPTVNKMTGLALQRLEAMDPALYETTAERLFGENKIVSSVKNSTLPPQSQSHSSI